MSSDFKDKSPAAASEQHKVVRAAGIVGLSTLASRIGGFVRDMVIAFFFGAGPAADAFFVAFRIPNLLRRLVAEGALTIAFVPVFTEILTQKGKEEALLMFRATATLLALCLFLICLAGILLADPILNLIAPGFAPQGPAYVLGVKLTAWCFPYIFFISLTALAAGVLNSTGRFFAPAFAPLLLNLTLIASAVCLAPYMDPPVMSLAVGVLLGGAAQLLFQAPFLKAQGFSFIPIWRPKHPALLRMLKLMLPAAFGAAVYQLAVLMNTILASFLPTGSVSYLYYADRLVEFPLGIFAIALGTAILPSLSRQAAAGDYDALKATMLHGFRLTLFICLPAMVGLIVLAEPLVHLLFARGQFDVADTWATARALWGYGVGLWAFACLRVVLPAFYALKDTKTPVKVAAACLLLNLLLSLPLMWLYEQMGLALATSLSSTANLVLLLILLRRPLGSLGLIRLLRQGSKIMLAAGCMGLGTGVVAFALPWSAWGGWAITYLRPLGAIMAGIIIYFTLAALFKLDELSDIKKMIRKKQ